MGWAYLSDSYPRAIAVTVVWATRGNKLIVDSDTVLNTDVYFTWTQANITSDPNTAVLPSTAAYDVDVRTEITDNSATGLNKKYLYYIATKQSVASPPSNIVQYNALSMNPVSGSIYNAVIPKQKDKRVWYFMISQDNQGNWDRDPELQNTAQYTAYTFDQDNPCNNTPNPPTGVGLDQNTMTLSWVAPTFNTDGSPINDLAGFNIYQSINNAPFSGTPTTTVGPGIASYTDTSMSDCKSVRYKIEAIEKEKYAVEDEILSLMEAIDIAGKELKAEEVKVKAEKDKTEAFKKEIEKKIAEAEKELTDKKAKRTEVATRIDPEIYNDYMTVLEANNGGAVAEGRDEICQGCNMNIPPQMFVEIKKNEEIIQCPQCRRILYWKEKNEGV